MTHPMREWPKRWRWWHRWYWTRCFICGGKLNKRPNRLRLWKAIKGQADAYMCSMECATATKEWQN